MKPNPLHYPALFQVLAGSQGDWKKLGIKIRGQILPAPAGEFLPGTKIVKLEAYTPEGELVGMATLTIYQKKLHPYEIGVSPKVRRQGLGTALYQEAERLSGMKIETPEEDNHSEEAEGLWSQPNRPFGALAKVLAAK